MDFLQEFNRIMENTATIALATSEDNVPSVRIVNFYYNEGVVYIATFRQSPKTTQFLQNKNVAFTTIPTSGSEFVRVKNAIVQKSNLTIFDTQDGFSKNHPPYKEIIKHTGNMMDVYEIHFNGAFVTLGHNQSGKVNL